jgi:hypothetical protein
MSHGQIGDIVALLKHRQSIYRLAFEGDLARLRTVHGHAIVDEALRRLVETVEDEPERPPRTRAWRAR